VSLQKIRPVFASIRFLNSAVFYGVRLLASRPTPNLEDQGVFLCLGSTFDLSGMGGPTSSYATAGIVLRVTESHKLPHHYKVETPSGEV